MNTTVQQPAVVLVEYVGSKPEKSDNLYGTGLTWYGHGDVQEVPANKWAAMKKHADVWREYAPDAAGSSLAPIDPPAPPAAPAQPPVPPTGNDTLSANTGAEPPDPQWRALGRDDLFNLAVERGLNPHHQLGKDKLLKLLGL